MTLHRLLGWRPDVPSRFRHDHRRPLPYDVVVVDEASMVSLPLMAEARRRRSTGSRIVLVGDRDQLASVEAGAVLGDLCGPRGQRVDRAGLEGSSSP
jgi:exodeoxyribonuclease V alpha subunit